MFLPNKLIKFSVVMFYVLFGMSCLAADPAPLAMIRSVSDKMTNELDKNLAKLKKNKSLGELEKNNKLVYDLVNQVLIPNFDLSEMSKAVVGRDWQNASISTQEKFIKEFTCYIIRTYSSALQSYDGEKIKFYPIRGKIGDRTKINSDLILKNGPPIQMQYSLMLKDGRWLIYDFGVDGVSIIKNYNSQFVTTLRQGGLDALVKKLHENNNKK